MQNKTSILPFVSKCSYEDDLFLKFKIEHAVKQSTINDFFTFVSNCESTV